MMRLLLVVLVLGLSLARVGASSCDAGWRDLEEMVTKAGSSFGFNPRLRREIGKQIENCGANEGHQTFLKKLVNDFYIKYVESMYNKFSIHLLHLSKSGGTTLCNIAETVGCSSPAPKGENCWCRECEDGPRWMEIEKEEKRFAERFWVDPRTLRPVEYESCGARSQWVLKNKLGMFANENFLQGGVRSSAGVALCPEFINVAIFRDPRPRSISHLFQLGESHYLSSMESFDAAVDRYPRVVNNYMLRSLLGEEAFQRPLQGLSEAHLDAGLAIIEDFDVLLTTDMLQDEPTKKLVLQRGLGWNMEQIGGLSKLDGRRKGWGFNESQLTSQELGELDQLNALDRRLYNRVDELARWDLSFYRFLETASPFTPPRDRSCTLACGFVCQD